ncbi:hypothetical protein RJ640_024388 [Escallonia rubra]|uniref:CCHC-type domain-containing protein n=1 Tax=Escallonia rubra TaxID=112253 RepID=A0AA88UE48_9ASTE|nr:hypothetical protein RJ640_024388 [Escallonia rubra]
MNSSTVNGTSSSSQGEGLVVRSENKNGHGRGIGRSRSRNPVHGKDRSKSRGKHDKSNIECWYCKEIGHIARKCSERKEKKNGKKHVNNANVAEEDDKSSDGDLYLVSLVEQQEGNLLSVRDNSFFTEWFIDSACSFHKCPHKEWFDCLTPCDGGTVLMGNDVVCKVMGIGTIKIKMFDGIVRTLGDVRYIPDLKKNLISLGTLDSIDCSISIKGGVMKVSKGAMVIMKGQKTGNLYKLIGNTVIGGASVSTHICSSNDNSELWHKRLGHLSEGELHEERIKSADESTDGSIDEPSLEDPDEHPSDSWNIVRDREPRTKKPTQRYASKYLEQRNGQMKQGNKSGEDWKPEVYFEAVEHLNSAFNLDLTRDKIKYRVKTWQRYYTVIMDVKASQYGFSWNEEEKRMVRTMVEYVAWGTYVKSNPDARGMQNKVIANWDDLVLLYGKDLDSGRGAETIEEALEASDEVGENQVASDPVAPSPVRPSSLLVARQSVENMANEGENEAVLVPMEPPQIQPSSPTTSMNKLHRKMRRKDPLADSMAKVAMSLKAYLASKKKQEVQPTGIEIYTVVSKVPGLSHTEVFIAVQKLIRGNPEEFNLLKALSDKEKEGWI